MLRDRDKLLKPVRRGDYNEKYRYCDIYRKNWKEECIPCEIQNIRIGSRKLAEICRDVGTPMKMFTWDCDTEGGWAEHVKRWMITCMGWSSVQVLFRMRDLNENEGLKRTKKTDAH